MAVHTDRRWFLEVPVPANLPPAVSRLLGSARALVATRADQLLGDLETRSVRVANGVAEQAGRVMGRLAAGLGIASHDGVADLRQRLGRIERKLTRLAKEREDRRTHATGADGDQVPPPPPPWPD